MLRGTLPNLTDKRHLLHDWAKAYLASFDGDLMVRQGSTAFGIAAHPLTPRDWHHDKALLLAKMRDVLATDKQHELVGSIQKDPIVLPWAAAAEPPMLALGVFSRGTFKDDRGRSIRKHIEEKLNQTLPGGCAIDVFAIEGIAAAPGLATACASALMSNIGQYARQEQRTVVVPKHAYIGFDGTDLTEYYVRIGFDKVEMVDGTHELVYSGTSPLEKPVETEKSYGRDEAAEQIMVGLGLWTGNELES